MTLLLVVANIFYLLRGGIFSNYVYKMFLLSQDLKNIWFFQIRILITLRIESSIIRIDSNITDNIVRKVINVL